MEVTLGKAFARSERLLSLKAGGWLSSCSKSRSFQRTMRTNLHTEGWVVSTNSHSSLVTCKPHLSVEEVIMQQTGLVWACFYLALVVSGLKLDCSARKVVCTGPYRATLKLVQETHFLFWLLLRWATDCWMEGAEGELQIFPGMRWINQCFMQKTQSKVKSQTSLQSVDAVAFILWILVPVSMMSSGNSQPCPPCTITQVCLFWGSQLSSRIWRSSDPSVVADEKPVAPWAWRLDVPLVKPKKRQ